MLIQINYTEPSKEKNNDLYVPETHATSNSTQTVTMRSAPSVLDKPHQYLEDSKSPHTSKIFRIYFIVFVYKRAWIFIMPITWKPSICFVLWLCLLNLSFISISHNLFHRYEHYVVAFGILKNYFLSVAVITKQQLSVRRFQPSTYTERWVNWMMPCRSHCYATIPHVSK